MDWVELSSCTAMVEALWRKKVSREIPSFLNSIRPFDRPQVVFLFSVELLEPQNYAHLLRITITWEAVQWQALRCTRVKRASHNALPCKISMQLLDMHRSIDPLWEFEGSREFIVNDSHMLSLGQLTLNKRISIRTSAFLGLSSLVVHSYVWIEGSRRSICTVSYWATTSMWYGLHYLVSCAPHPDSCIVLYGFRWQADTADLHVFLKVNTYGHSISNQMLNRPHDTNFSWRRC